jgi:hypothetical protein
MKFGTNDKICSRLNAGCNKTTDEVVIIWPAN